MGVAIVDYKTLNWVEERKRRSLVARKERQPAPERTSAASVPRRTGTPTAHAAVAGQPMDYVLLVVTLFLVGLGTVMVYSSSTVIAAAKFDGPMHFMIRHGFRALIGLGMLLVAVYMPVDRLRGGAVTLLLAAAFLLLLVPLAMGVAYKGARSWISIGGFTFQPSELMKFSLILFLADRLARQQERLASFANGLLPHLLIMALPLGMIVIEPDLGTAVAITLIIGVVMVAAQVRVRHLILLGLVAGVLVAVLIWIEPYRMSRLTVGYQIEQGFVALGSGGVFGRGLGRSLQKFFFLPEPYTDSIFPILGEELGLVGTLGTLALFAVFGWRGVVIAREQPSLFRFLLAVGLTANVVVYATVNIAVMTGLIPATGLPLPFISYGGSGLVLNLTAVGVLLGLSRRRREQAADATTGRRRIG